MNGETVIHLIANAHLDPVWLWPWQTGVDEALATCRSACDRLDAHPDLIFTRGEAWVYAQVERLDPALFDRIKAHVDAGRWEIVGGWWIQPDCNLPSSWGFEQQIELGRRYFESRFGRFPTIAYNVDSFGHAASLPTMMRAAGQSAYVMMRPQEHEMRLPSRVFRWRESEGSPEVTTFRIAQSYSCREISLDYLRVSLEAMPEGLGHTMCFIGVGDHGGGPTEEQIAWCREHRNAIPGVRLEFSSPSRYFQAIEDKVPSLPVVTGELQMHAIGCYSVLREVKTGVRRAEHLLEQAKISDPGVDLTEAWKRVCFAHFHDIMGGTSLPTAYRQQRDAVGYAATIADEAAQYGLRKRLSVLPDAANQRIVAFNASDSPYQGHLEFEPWLDWMDWDKHCGILDQDGIEVPFQRIHSESLAFVSHTDPEVNYGLPRLLFEAKLAPGELRCWSIDRSLNPSTVVTKQDGPYPDFASNLIRFDDDVLPMPHLALLLDRSDTWSHGLDRFSDEDLDLARFEFGDLTDNGPLMRSWFGSGSIGSSDWWSEWRSYRGEPFIELRLRVAWREAHHLLKLVWPQSGVKDRVDGIPGSSLPRPNDGRELPMRDWTANGTRAVIAPEVYGLDSTEDRIRLTLLRSSLMAHHDPHGGINPRSRFADQGEHELRFRFFAGTVPTETLNRHAFQMQRPPLLADLTRGMPQKI